MLLLRKESGKNCKTQKQLPICGDSISEIILTAENTLMLHSRWVDAFKVKSAGSTERWTSQTFYNLLKIA